MDDGRDFEDLLVFLRESRGVDFTGYKRTSLRRLVSRRMRSVGAADVRSYLDALEVDAAEVRSLFDSLLINVTAFFRDEAVWTSLREVHLPELLARTALDEPVRVLECRLRHRRGGVHPRHRPAPAARGLRVQAARQGLRHRRRRAGAGRRAGRPVHRGRAGAPRRGAARRLLRAGGRGLDLPRRPEALAHLRPARPARRRPDLAGLAAGLPQRAHVLHRRDAGAHPRALRLRPRRVRPAGARQGRDAADAQRPVRRGRPVAPRFPRLAATVGRAVPVLRAGRPRTARRDPAGDRGGLPVRPGAAGRPGRRRPRRAGQRQRQARVRTRDGGRRPALPGDGGVLPPGRPAARRHRRAGRWPLGGRAGRPVVAAGRRGPVLGRAGRSAARPGRAARADRVLGRRHAVPRADRRADPGAR